MDFELESYKLNDLKVNLKRYQIDIIDELLKNNDVETAIEMYLSANGPSATTLFGGQPIQRNSRPFKEKFKEEFDKLICGHPDYAAYYPKISNATANYSKIIIASISSALGATLGLSAAFISPAVVLALSLLVTMGRKAYCSDKKHLLPPDEEKTVEKING